MSNEQGDNFFFWLSFKKVKRIKRKKNQKELEKGGKIYVLTIGNIFLNINLPYRIILQTARICLNNYQI